MPPRKAQCFIRENDKKSAGPLSKTDKKLVDNIYKADKNDFTKGPFYLIMNVIAPF
jgi:hypothetical protein